MRIFGENVIENKKHKTLNENVREECNISPISEWMRNERQE